MELTFLVTSSTAEAEGCADAARGPAAEGEVAACGGAVAAGSAPVPPDSAYNCCGCRFGLIGCFVFQVQKYLPISKKKYEEYNEIFPLIFRT